MAVEPEPFLKMYPEYIVPEDQKKAWFEDRTGAIVGKPTAERFGWKIGDRVPLISPIFNRPDGTPWTFTIRGIYDGGKEGRGRHAVLLQPPVPVGDVPRGELHRGQRRLVHRPRERSGERRSDRPAHRRAVRELGERDQDGDREARSSRTSRSRSATSASIVTAITGAVFFTILLVAGNTMAQSVRERTGELAVLKTLGFTDGKVLGLVLLESVLHRGARRRRSGSCVGWLLVSAGDPTGGFLPAFYYPPAPARPRRRDRR